MFLDKSLSPNPRGDGCSLEGFPIKNRTLAYPKMKKSWQKTCNPTVTLVADIHCTKLSKLTLCRHCQKYGGELDINLSNDEYRCHCLDFGGSNVINVPFG